MKTEVELDMAVAELKELTPHSNLSDLIFYPERDRTQSEIVDEAILREKIWTEQGQAVLEARIESQMIATLTDVSLPESDHRKISAETLLRNIRKGSSHS